MIITPRNVPGTIYLIASIFFIKSISTVIAILLVKRISSCFLSLLHLRVQLILPIGCFIGYADPSFFLNITSNMFLTGFSSGRVISFTLNFLYLKFNIIFSIFIEILFYIPVITRAFLLITC